MWLGFWRKKWWAEGSSMKNGVDDCSREQRANSRLAFQTSPVKEGMGDHSQVLQIVAFHEVTAKQQFAADFKYGQQGNSHQSECTR